MKFKVGDKVRDITPSDPCYGLVGVVKELYDDSTTLAVDFEEYFEGEHDAECGAKHGWWVVEEDLELVAPACVEKEHVFSEKVAAADIPTPEAEDNTADITAAELPKGRLMRAFEKYEAAVQQENEALEEIEQILKEMRKR